MYDLRVHECAQIRPSIGSFGYRFAYMSASQTLTNGKSENSIFK